MNHPGDAVFQEAQHHEDPHLEDRDLPQSEDESPAHDHSPPKQYDELQHGTENSYKHHDHVLHGKQEGDISDARHVDEREQHGEEGNHPFLHYQKESTPDKRRVKNKENEENESTPEVLYEMNPMVPELKDATMLAQEECIKNTPPTTELELALTAILARKMSQIERLMNELEKLQSFVAKRKQTYKRKRKEEGAPTRALSAYNLFIRERFAQLAKENEKALKSEDSSAEMKRVPPASLVAKTGNEWKELPAEIKAQYEERAKADRKRYEEQMAQYQPPDKHSGRKRNKTGYNMFFSAHVLRLKQTENGVPSERGSVARLVGNAWKQLSAEDKQYYEREADKHNGMNPMKDGEEDEDDDEVKMPHHMDHQYAYPPHGEMAVHPMQGVHIQHAQHDPRAHHQYYAPHMYAQNPYGHYDYSQHHQRHHQSRQQMYSYAPHGRHYDHHMGM